MAPALETIVIRLYGNHSRALLLSVLFFPFFPLRHEIVWHYCLHGWDGRCPTKTEMLASAGVFSALKFSYDLGLTIGFP